ncbi:MAG: alpha-glucan family phosphorylase, partial [Weeksellaceae bacterium]|nr:alpha-glucan family phosphorylase [Weeksellaceae bacterium]
MDFKKYNIPFDINPTYNKSIAYFSMEFAIDQSLKTYSGGLGFLAGSHMRSAYSLRQNLVGIGILWKYGYYDQQRNQDKSLKVTWVEKDYSFLEDTHIRFQIKVDEHPVWVKAYYLNPEIFHTAPIFFLSTDLPENDYLARSICHRLYDGNPAAKVAQYILLGKGGAKLLDEIGSHRDIYHLNEAHGLPAAFYLLKKYNDLSEVNKRLVFTTHTPEEAGNEKHDFDLCYKMSYFSGMSREEVRAVTGLTSDEPFNHSLVALRLSHVANGVSKLHGVVSNQMWGKHPGICKIKSVTNSQDYLYWADKKLYHYADEEAHHKFDDRKRQIKAKTFKIVADQTGKLFNPKVFTMVWARRFAGYKRADLLLNDPERFNRLLNHTKYPVQLIWAGKPYPLDQPAIDTFNQLIYESNKHGNMAVLTGYELELSRRLKAASDVWLNTPRVPREASGTSGMTAAMNGGVNFS